MQNKRRNFLKGLAGIAGACTAIPGAVRKTLADERAPTNAKMSDTVRDRLWIWGHAAGVHNGMWGLPETSRMTPAEGAFYLGVPNLLMVGLSDPKVPSIWKPPVSDFDAYATSFRPLKRVVWSIGRSNLSMSPKDLDTVLQLAHKFPNITGIIMDDFLRATLDGSEAGNLTPGELAWIQSRLNVDGRKLDLWTTLYDHNLAYDLSGYLKHTDVITYWTPFAKDLDKLYNGFDLLEKTAPRHRKVLGCYMWDYGNHTPMPVPMMQKQCELGLKWLKEHRIEGIIFLASCICDLNLDAVEWTRNWIRAVGDEPVG